MCSLIAISTLDVAIYCYCCSNNNNNCHCYHYYCHLLPPLATTIAAIPLTSNLLALLLLPLTATTIVHSLLTSCHLPSASLLIGNHLLLIIACHCLLVTHWLLTCYCIALCYLQCEESLVGELLLILFPLSVSRLAALFAPYYLLPLLLLLLLLLPVADQQ